MFVCFSYSVIVQMVEFQHLEMEKNDNSLPSTFLSWPQLCGVSRVNGHAAKVLHFCVLLPGFQRHVRLVNSEMPVIERKDG